MSFNGGQMYKVGDFSLDTHERVLRLNGDLLPLTPKMYDLLLLLVHNQGRLVEKEKILETVWPDSFVEEGNLAVTIRQLRKVLGDDAHNPTYIQTVARRGYRLIADVRELNDSIPQHPEPVSRPIVLVTVSIVLLLSLLGLAFVWFQDVRPKVPGQTANRLTTNGKVTVAAITPDGHTLVFAQKDTGGESLWKRDIATGNETQIFPTAAIEFVGLSISPASDYAYYSVFSDNAAGSNFSRVPLAGGTPESFPEIASDVTVSFSPDGLSFAYTESHSAVKETSLKIANADGTQPRTLLTAKGEKRVLPIFRVSPVAWSPSGDIACAVQEADEKGVYYRILLVNPNDGSEKYLSDQRWDFIESIVWKDSEDLAVTNLEPNSPGRQIWLVSRTNGEAKRIKPNSKEYEWLSAADGRLFAVEKTAHSSICIADFPEGLTTAETKQIFNEPGYVEDVEWLGDKILYNSWASGKNEIWQINPDGTEPKQLTSNSNLTLGFAVSPIDGTLVFTATQKAADSLFIADADGKNIRQLTFGTFDAHPKFTPDGKKIVFQHGSLVSPTIWEVFIEPDQKPRQLTGYRAERPSISPDGKAIAYQFMDFISGRQIWKLGIMDSANGTLLNKIDFPALITNRNIAWRPGDNLLTLAVTSGATSGLIFLSPTGNFSHTIENVTNDKISAFVWSPDGKRLAFSSNHVSSDAVVLDED